MSALTLACTILLANVLSADTLKVGTRFPRLAFQNEAGNQLTSISQFQGKKTIAFIFASW